jgi:hypothetical protein
MALSLFLISVGISSLQIARAETTYQFKTVFEQDLSTISRHTPHIEEIQVIQVFNMERSVAIRIGYSQGLSDPTKIALQDEVQEALQQKSYIESIGKNYISCILEDKSCPPWPGFVIGELMVMFIDVPTDPLIHPWPDGSTLVASNVGSTSLTLTWSNTRDGSHTVAYRLSDSYNLWLTVSNITHTLAVSGLTPATMYNFRVAAISEAGDYWLGPTTSAVTLTAATRDPGSGPTANPAPTPPRNPAAVPMTTLNQILPFFLRNWYIFILGISMSAIAGVFLLRRR